MTRINNLSDNSDAVARLQRNIEDVAKGAPLESSSISNGRLRVIGGQLLGEAGARLDWHGDAQLDGDVEITHSLTVAGNTTISGSVRITDSLEVSAETTLNGTLHVDAGQIKAGAVVIDGADGGRVAAPGGTLALVGSQITLTGATTARNGILSEGPIVALGDVSVSGRLTVDTLPTAPTGATVYQLVVGTNGRLYRGAEI